MAAAAGMVLSVAQTLLAALQNQELRDACSIFGYESQLEKLQDTMTTIKALLVDVESNTHPGLTEEGRHWVEKLKDAIYDADDLFDEFSTIVQQMQRVPAGKILKKVRCFFSGNNQLLFATSTSRKIKKLREKLNSIANDHHQFGSRDLTKSIARIKETSSYVYEQSIIGREVDKEAIVQMLLPDFDSSVEDNVSFVTIVGIGRLGKTALAQLVYNDDRIKAAFQKMFWVCVSKEQFGMKEVLVKMLRSATEQNRGDLGIDELHRNVRQYIEGIRFLLVLDDMWNENPVEWGNLRNFLVLGGKGSKILVTSRSMTVARAIGKKNVMYELQGLSEVHSWRLFKSIAFEDDEEEEDLEDSNDLVKIGKDIVKKCAKVPLSIRVMASLLHKQDKSKWISFQSIDFARMKQDDDHIMPILLFSYYDLPFELKSCFSYCSLFPKDYVIKKDVLISLWLAQGFLVPNHQGQSMEDVGEEYFSILLHRCFFQEITKDEYGKVFSCKMHDLICDLAQKVAGKESLMFTTDTSHLEKKTRHLSICNWFTPSYSSGSMEKMRTFLPLSFLWNSYEDVALPTISNCRRLRVLDLHDYDMRTLPSALGALLHLRYLNLSGSLWLEMLPKSITQLHNLETLKLNDCWRLKELPQDLSALVKLRHLDIIGCKSLSYMPAGMNKLTCLHTLTVFLVVEKKFRQVEKGELKDLKALVNLRGELHLKLRRLSSNAVEGADILRKAHLQALAIDWEECEQGHDPHSLLESLYPHRDLSKIVMCGYQGTRLSNWAMLMDNSLPKLVRIKLSKFNALQHLPSLSRLRLLKFLELEGLPNVEYIEGDRSYLRAGSTTFFPSLEKLELVCLPNLKGWWRNFTEVNANGGKDQQPVIPSFPSLRYLSIRQCPSMIQVPPCPQVKKLCLFEFNEALTFCMKGGVVPMTVPTSTSLSSFCDSVLLSSKRGADPILHLDELEIDDVGFLNSLFSEFVGATVGMIVKKSQVENLLIGRKGLEKCSSSLANLSIEECRKLKTLLGGGGGGIEHFTNLQSLSFKNCYILDLEETKEGKPWKYLHTLSSLTLVSFRELQNLPKGLLYLTSLQSLTISRCDKLEFLPDWLSSLTSLQSLQVYDCPKLKASPEALCHLTFIKKCEIHRCGALRERESYSDGEEDKYQIPHIAHTRHPSNSFMLKEGRNPGISGSG